jgi:hypothetical protein
MHSMEADNHRPSDQVGHDGQLQSKFDRVAFHRDLIRLIVGMELQKKDPHVSGYQNGQVLYKTPSETPDTRRFRIFGMHKFIGSGLYGKDGSWVQWVQAFLKDRDRRMMPHQKAAGDDQDRR